MAYTPIKSELTVLTHFFRAYDGYSTYLPSFEFFKFLAHFSLYALQTAYRVHKGDDAKLRNFHIWSSLGNVVTWHRHVNKLNDLLIWVPFVTEIRIHCSWQRYSSPTDLECASRYRKNCIFTQNVCDRAYGPWGSLLCDCKPFFLQSWLIPWLVKTIFHVLIKITSSKQIFTRWKFPQKMQIGAMLLKSTFSSR